MIDEIGTIDFTAHPSLAMFWGFDIKYLSTDALTTIINSVADGVQGELAASGYIAYVGSVARADPAYLASLTLDQREAYLAELETNYSSLLSEEKNWMSNMADGHSSEFDKDQNDFQYAAAEAWAYYDQLQANYDASRDLTSIAQNIFAQHPGDTVLATHLFAQVLVNNGYGDLVTGYHADGVYNGRYVGGSSGGDANEIWVLAGHYVAPTSFPNSLVSHNGLIDFSFLDHEVHHVPGTDPNAAPPASPGANPDDVKAADFNIIMATDDNTGEPMSSASDLHNFEKVLQYLSNSPTAEAMLKDAVARGVTVILINAGISQYNADTNKIYFDPSMAVRQYDPTTGLTSVISSAQAFMHELGSKPNQRLDFARVR